MPKAHGVAWGLKKNRRGNDAGKGGAGVMRGLGCWGLARSKLNLELI